MEPLEGNIFGHISKGHSMQLEGKLDSSSHSVQQFEDS